MSVCPAFIRHTRLLQMIVVVSPATAEARELIRELDLDIATLCPGLPINGIDATEFESAGGYFVIAREAGEAVGCGAFRPVGALKAQNRIAQGDALGHDSATYPRPERAKQNLPGLCRPFRALPCWALAPGRCPGLRSFGLSALSVEGLLVC